MNQSYENSVSRIRKENEEREAKLKNEYESYILGLKSEKNAEEREHKRLKDEYRMEQTKLITEIYHLKQAKMALQ